MQQQKLVRILINPNDSKECLRLMLSPKPHSKVDIEEIPRCVVYSSHIKPSKVKGEFPEIAYEYIANDSMIPWHYTFTPNLKEAYIFEDFQRDEAKEVAHLWNMKVKELDL